MSFRLRSLPLLGLLCPFLLPAQITLDGADVPPIGASLTTTTDTLVAGLEPGPAGAGQSWDFTMLAGQDSITNLVVDPATTPDGAAFPEATFAFQGAGDFYSYAQVTDVALLALGGSALLPTGGDPVILRFTPPQQLLPVPATLGSTFTNDFGFLLELDGSMINPLIDSVRVVETGSQAAEADAYGTLALPNATFEALRQRVETVTMDSIFVKFFGNWSLFEATADTVISYEWWAKDGRGTVLALDFDLQGNALEATYLADYDEVVVAPVAAFTVEILEDGAVQFTDASINEPVEWLWNFGDGTTSTEQNPLHTYLGSGQYNVCLTASNSAGESTVCQDVDVEVVVAPVAAFTVEILGDGAVQFTDGSANEPVEWLWDFGDGTTSTEQNPLHTYLGSGQYNVCLTASNAAGESTVCQDVEVEVVVAPVAAFTVEILEDGAVQFTDGSANEPMEWLWDFGDGTTSTEQNPLHTYLGSGQYNVCLTASNAAGESTVCQDVEVEVVVAPVAAFTVEILEDGAVQFTDGSANEPVEWLWDFGDGTTSTEQNPLHTYLGSGQYNVCLTASNSAGESTVCQDVNVVINSNSVTGQVEGLKVYPSPARDVLFLEFGALAGQPLQLRCFNALGQLMRQQRVENAPSGSWALDISGWQPGLYRISVETEGQKVKALLFVVQ